MIRGTVRPLPQHEVLRGLRVTGFYDHDAYLESAERRRALVGATFEHPRVNAGGNYLATTDQPRAAARELDGDGFSIWATPRFVNGWEALLRFDRLDPDGESEARRQRTILGVAYWFQLQGNVTSALLFDFENVDNDRFLPARPDERRYALHMLINY